VTGGTFVIDDITAAALDALRRRLNDDRPLVPGEKFDLGRRLDAALFAMEQGRLPEPPAPATPQSLPLPLVP